MKKLYQSFRYEKTADRSRRFLFGSIEVLSPRQKVLEKPPPEQAGGHQQHTHSEKTPFPHRTPLI